MSLDVQAQLLTECAGCVDSQEGEERPVAKNLLLLFIVEKCWKLYYETVLTIQDWLCK